MAFQGAGQAQQPGLAYQLGSVKAVEKLMFDIYPIYDKSLSLTKTKEKKMGLDQFAHLRDQKPDWEKIYSDEHEPKKDGKFDHHCEALRFLLTNLFPMKNRHAGVIDFF